MKTPFLASFAALGALLVAGCGSKTPAENSADQLDRAADQSTPEAANVLENQADQIRAGNVSDPNAAQNALQAAGNAQAAARQSAPSMGATTQTGGDVGAKPHRAGDPVPPPKLKAGQGMTGSAGSNEPAGPR
jgi:hypothetical protein